jgi:hypothetical protein
MRAFHTSRFALLKATRVKFNLPVAMLAGALREIRGLRIHQLAFRNRITFFVASDGWPLNHSAVSAFVASPLQ